MSVATDKELNPEMMIEGMGKKARVAAAALVKLNPDIKNKALLAIVEALLDQRAEIQAENAKDLAAGEENGLSTAMLDRLKLTDARIEGMAQSLREVAMLDDPVGEIYDMKTRPNGLKIGRMRAPIGVVGIIYESRPNVTVDAGALCIKSGNAAILRGGKEAIHSNRILAKIMDEAGIAAGLPEGAVQLIPVADRALVGAMLKANQYIDIIIPRGGKSLIERIMNDSIIPVIKHLDGICHVYVDDAADLEMAESITFNAKVQRPGVCNALETLVVHQSVAEKFLPDALKKLADAGVEIRGDETVQKLFSDAKAATEEDWHAEYLELILAVKVVNSFESAVDFINGYSSQHTETIVTEDYSKAMRFLREIDSACVHVNASTRFSDGGQYGMGCEIGISTDKLHARGPMGLVELTTSKFVVLGNGQIRE